MGNIFKFWWLCVKTAVRGNAASANDWQWVFANPLWQSIGSAVGAALGAFASRYWHGAPMMSPDTTIGVFLGGLFGFAFTWLIFFIVHFVRAPATLYYEQKDKADSLGARLQAKSEIPDLDVVIATLPEICSTKIEDPPPKEGIYIFIRDIRFTNRSSTPLSVEVRLNIFFGDDTSIAPYLCPKQEDIPFPGMEQAREATDASIGPHLGRIIAIPAMSTIHGYLTYFIAKNLALFFATAAQSRDMRVIDFLNSQKKTLTVIEHISGQQREMALDSTAPVNFRDKVEEI